MRCDRNETVPRLLVEVASTLSWFEVKQISCPSATRRVYAVVIPALAKYAQDGAPAAVVASAV
jgi:hypothetical protein